MHVHTYVYMCCKCMRIVRAMGNAPRTGQPVEQLQWGIKKYVPYILSACFHPVCLCQYTKEAIACIDVRMNEQSAQI